MDIFGGSGSSTVNGGTSNTIWILVIVAAVAFLGKKLSSGQGGLDPTKSFTKGA